MEVKRINWFAFTGGIITLIVLFISLFVPWWQLTVGEDLLRVNASPVNTNFGLLGSQFTIPLIFALNLVSILMLSASGIIMLFYSLTPTRSYSHHLLSFAYKKPLFSVIFFVGGLLVITSIASVLGLHIPLMGSSIVVLPSEFTGGININAIVSGNFQLPFWLAIIAVAFCVAARLYHERVKGKTNLATVI
jgi:hypothetical protein